MSEYPSVATLGMPRIGPRRELKFALESYWSGRISSTALLETAAALRAANWARQKARGVDVIPSSDFSLYDHVLDTSAMVGAIPAAYGWTGGAVSLDTVFAMARGSQTVAAQEMTKWFDTNYHYMVPEFSRGQTFELSQAKPIDEFVEAKALGYHTRPVLLGPVTFLGLGKGAADPLSLLPGLVPVYAEVLRRLAAAGADWVQIDEPCLVLDLDDVWRKALTDTYRILAGAAGIKIMLTGYFGGLGDNLDCVAHLPIAGLHLDLVRAPEQFGAVLAKLPAESVLSLGCIDGRNIWRANLSAVLNRIAPVAGTRALQLAPSCSLLHVPVDLDLETDLDPEVKSWLAFAVQKIDELTLLRQALAGEVVDLSPAAAIAAARAASPKVHDAGVAARMAAVTKAMSRRTSRYAERSERQRARLDLPRFPTTTIGSFPQTAEVRQARAAHGKGTMSDADYDAFLRSQTEAAIRWQEEIGLDVLVHGEFERNDMVQYFGEKLAGFAFTRFGWVQSYGSRCVRPPVIFGDVSRREPMTVEWAVYAQSLTSRPVKGMLTGPVTVLQWSFVRDDLPRSAVCRQIALALRDEVADLEAAGIGIIQVDEPALREGLPLRRAEWQEYLDWAAEAFRLTVAGARDETQIHTHMCYAEFNDIVETIAGMDADVISIEAARSKMDLLDAFVDFHYPNEIGPGVYDIHSPRIPSIEEMTGLLQKAAVRIPAERLWVNPDCGLKTRRWEEAKPALANMAAAAKRMRDR